VAHRHFSVAFLGRLPPARHVFSTGAVQFAAVGQQDGTGRATAAGRGTPALEGKQNLGLMLAEQLYHMRGVPGAFDQQPVALGLDAQPSSPCRLEHR
jgi:hypothetical protein